MACTSAVVGPFELVHFDEDTMQFVPPSADVATQLSAFKEKPFKIVCIGGQYRWVFSTLCIVSA
jgi:hypothetical protein